MAWIRGYLSVKRANTIIGPAASADRPVSERLRRGGHRAFADGSQTMRTHATSFIGFIIVLALMGTAVGAHSSSKHRFLKPKASAGQWHKPITESPLTP